ncbi:MAG TPA: hypothetical protein VN253_28480, partial [Kofleriaceae bacterium]|nr:hypothetical protein [Kofleriaceae bacterium]
AAAIGVAAIVIAGRGGDAPAPSASSASSASTTTATSAPDPAPAAAAAEPPPGAASGASGADDRAEPPPAPPAATAAAEPDPVAALVAQADELAAARRRDAAISLLVKARKTYPRDARLPYRAGLLYIEKLFRTDGLKQLRAALELEPSYRTDTKLIQAVVGAFNATAQYDWALAQFLRKDIGDAAKPVLEDVAAHHPNPIVRARAAAELRRY